LERGAGLVIFSDVSQDLLDESKRLATELGAADRCRFVVAAADDLSPIGDESVDVVTTRSVLIYVEDKARAFREFYRVLGPGGRSRCSSRSTASTASAEHTKQATSRNSTIA